MTDCILGRKTENEFPIICRKKIGDTETEVLPI